MGHFTNLLAIAVVRPDGGITVRRLPISASEDCYSPNVAEAMKLTLVNRMWIKVWSDADIEADLHKCGIAWTSWKRVAETDLPARDEYRNAWTMIGQRVTHDMAKARVILRDRLRAERAPLLAALDVEYQRADETADTAAKGLAVAEKQALRDVTANPAIDLAMTVDELKSLTLDALTVTPIAVVTDAKLLA